MNEEKKTIPYCLRFGHLILLLLLLELVIYALSPLPDAVHIVHYVIVVLFIVWYVYGRVNFHRCHYILDEFSELQKRRQENLMRNEQALNELNEHL